MQFYAIIRKQSKYHNQQDYDGKKPIAFPMQVNIAADPYWPVKGGLGGQYTLYDIDLFFKKDGKIVPVSLHKAPGF